MNFSSRAWIMLAGLLGASGVALGALAAHAVSDPVAMASLERASTYQILHAVALLALSGVSIRLMGLARIVMLLGIIGFSGAIYAKYLLGLPLLGKLAPTGGTALIVSWLLVLISAMLSSRSESGEASDSN